MASSSKQVERLMITLEPMEVVELERIVSYNALSQVPDGVIVKGDLSSYLNCKIEDLGSLSIYSQLKFLCDKSGKIQPKYIRVYEKGFHNATYFLEDFEEEHIRIILSSVHGENMYLERTHTITKEAIHVVTSFWSTGEVPKLRQISKETITTLTSSTSNGNAFFVNNIKDPMVKLATMAIGYRIFYSSRMNSVPSVAVHTTYKMIDQNIDYDLCEAISSQLMLNL